MCVGKLKLATQRNVTQYNFFNQFLNQGSIMIDGKRVFGDSLTCTP